MRSQYEVAAVLEKLGSKTDEIGLNTWQLRTLSAIKNCRTAELGGHVDSCDCCGHMTMSYNSCRNRHCPKCQGKNREEWIASRMDELLPVPYFHVVFTLPDLFNTLAMHKPKFIYDLLFESAWETLNTFGKKKEVQMGMIAVLHTWGQNLNLHPHLHCIVPGGGVQETGIWKNIRSDGKYLFPVKALSKVYRAKFCEKIKKQLPQEYGEIEKELWKKEWVVFAKEPFGSSKTVIEYLGRYTHKIAISNHRIREVEEKTVTFDYKDYREKGKKKRMVLSHEEFIRRFSLHILPKRFVKIRHYGILSSNWKRKKLKALQGRMNVQKIQQEKKEREKKYLRKCPCCKTGNMYIVLMFDKRGPPPSYMGVSQPALTSQK